MTSRWISDMRSSLLSTIRTLNTVAVATAVVVMPLTLAQAPQAHARPANGPELWKLCGQCHGDKGEGKALVGAPAIAGMPEWYVTAQLTKFKYGARAAHPKDIIGLRMRPMGRHLSDGDIPVISKFVAGMPVTMPPATLPGNALKGEKNWQVCIACHGQDGLGNQQLGAPPLIYTNDWYLVQQLKNFKGAIRGGDATIDPMGASMQAISNTLADEQAMRDVVAYIHALRPAPKESK
jgi:cytochrome c553